MERADIPGALSASLPPATPASSSRPAKGTRPNDYPLSSDKKPGNGPMDASAQGPAPPMSSGSRSQIPAPENGAGAPSRNQKRKKKNKRRPRNRQQAVFTSAENLTSHERPATSSGTGDARDVMEGDRPLSKDKPPFYKLGNNLSNTSIESDALLDHRDQPMMRPRRDSRLPSSFRPSSLLASASAYRSTDSRSRTNASGGSLKINRMKRAMDQTSMTEHLCPLSSRPRPPTGQTPSSQSTHSASYFPQDADRDYDVNNPPSMPGSPKQGPEMNYDDAVVTGVEFDFPSAWSLENRRESVGRPNDAVIDMDGASPRQNSEPASPTEPLSSQELRRRRTVTLPVEEDVCFPAQISELGDEGPRISRDETGERRRRRHRQWPDLSVLEEWSREEKEDRSGDVRVKKISEPVLIEGRLRPQYKTWRREEDDAPYRFTYFNEEFQSTIHAQTISELVQPDPPELEDSSSDEEEDDHFASEHQNPPPPASLGPRGGSSQPDLHSSTDGVASWMPSNGRNAPDSGAAVPNGGKQQDRLSAIAESRPPSHRENSPSVSHIATKPKRYGPRPTFWLDVLSPTDAEMRVIAKTFGIHALTAEDIMMQEAREKVELFRSYYFVNYRTFEQDRNSEDYLEPVNMYVVVFREGVISFHFSQTPHPANVRRRIRQLMDYLILSSDWISYALIDDITDVFGPLIQAIEDEVDEIDEMIMQMHSSASKDGATNDTLVPSFGPGEMLRRVGQCRKKVMGLYRLLSNKADVVKGFAKRCNEQWEVAPKSEIGLYLGDIQDHIMTMTGNLTHYETILSRAHSNYLAQINILMNERQEQTADVLGKLTVLGTIVLPMNIICGMWGMNVKVPGQDVEKLELVLVK
ncbi:hypothetical protein N7470_001436 [Penicillium chermesinum]|nr:hypothetical protein N7470_001436 [Penicillium chermesinum]